MIFFGMQIFPRKKNVDVKLNSKAYFIKDILSILSYKYHILILYILFSTSSKTIRCRSRMYTVRVQSVPKNVPDSKRQYNISYSTLEQR